MVWVVANENKTLFLSFKDFDTDEYYFTDKWIESGAFDSLEEAVEWANKVSTCNKLFYARLR